jgi:hypothetical protein
MSFPRKRESSYFIGVFQTPAPACTGLTTLRRRDNSRQSSLTLIVQVSITAIWTCLTKEIYTTIPKFGSCFAGPTLRAATLYLSIFGWHPHPLVPSGTPNGGMGMAFSQLNKHRCQKRLSKSRFILSKLISHVKNKYSTLFYAIGSLRRKSCI